MSTHLQISAETTVPADHTEELWALYSAALEPLRRRQAGRQVLYRDEFLADLADPRVWKFVGWSDGRPVALASMTRHLASVPWLSPDYFAARFPEHAARNAIYYLGYLLVHPAHQHRGLLEELIDAGVARFLAQPVVCAYDACSFTAVDLGLADRVRASLARFPGVTVEQIDTQSYYAVLFH